MQGIVCFQQGQKEEGSVHPLGSGNNSGSPFWLYFLYKEEGGESWRNRWLQEHTALTVFQVPENCPWRCRKWGPRQWSTVTGARHLCSTNQLKWPRWQQGKHCCPSVWQLSWEGICFSEVNSHPDQNWKGIRETPSQPWLSGKTHQEFGMDVESCHSKCATGTPHTESSKPLEGQPSSCPT